MNVKELRDIIAHLPEETVVLIEGEDVYDVETVDIQIHMDGRVHLIFSAME